MWLLGCICEKLVLNICVQVLLPLSYFMSDQSPVNCELFHERPKFCYLWAISWATKVLLPVSYFMSDHPDAHEVSVFSHDGRWPTLSVTNFTHVRQTCNKSWFLSLKTNVWFQVVCIPIWSFKIIFLSYTWFMYICLFFLMKNLPSIFREFFTSVYLQLIHDIWL